MTEKKIYQTNLFPLSRSELVTKLKSTLSTKRLEHVLRVEQTALNLAEVNGVDRECASIASLCHDYAKERPTEDFIQVIKNRQLDPALLNYGNAIWHGIVGAEIVADELACYDQRILDAIRQHTVGAAYMTELAQVVYMADYIEPGRDFPGVEKARELTAQSLGVGVAYQLKASLEYLVEQHQPIYPGTLIAYNAWILRYGKEL